MPVILATWLTRNGRITVQGQSGEIVYETPFQPIAGHSGSFLSCRRLRSGELWFEASLGKKVCETSSQWRKTRDGGMYLSSQQW
jgi:hypothetical protein